MERTNATAAIYSSLFFLAFGLSVLMLLTDTNLRTDFGSMSSGYYAHWYVILAIAVADAIGGVLLVVVGSRTAIKGGVVGAGLIALIFAGDILTYSQVGFSSAPDFASYLFGWTYSGGDIRYLYDVLLAVYIVAFISGIVALAKTRPPDPSHP
ncbi:MAG: hypothetical protein ACREBT_02340 [Thermoplasmata archaeon]